MADTIVLDQQNRVGTFPTASLAVPAPSDVNPATGQPYALVRLLTTISDADALDATKGCILYLRASWDGTNYETLDTSTWTGGNRDKNGNPAGPSLIRSMPADAGGNWPARVMATLDTEGYFLNMGLTLGFE